MKSIKKTMVLLLSLVCILRLCSPVKTKAVNVWDSDFLDSQVTTVTETKAKRNNEFIRIAEKNNYSLFADKSSGCFYVEDCEQKNCWYSNPQNISEDDASGTYFFDACSLFTISYYDGENSAISKGNSEALGVKNGNVAFSEIPNGFCVKYKLSNANVDISLNITLTDSGINLTVPIDKLKDGGNLLSLSLLPFFNCGSKNDDGYILLPDGSGSLINFNNGRTAADEYVVPIYGKDITSSTVTKPQQVYDAKLPIYGIKNGKSSFLAVINEGAAQAKIHASVNGRTTSFANSYSEFLLRGSDTVILGENAGNPQSYQMCQNDEIDLKSISIDYLLFSGNDTDYNDMALAYRKTIVASYDMKEQSNSNRMYLDFYCATKKKKLFFGLPLTVTQRLSALGDIKKIVSDLNDNELSGINVVLHDWSKSQTSQKADKGLYPIGKVGTVNELKSLNNVLINQNGKLYPDFEIQKAAKSGNGVSIYRHSVINISNMPAGEYQYKLNTLVKKSDASKTFFLKSNVVIEQLKKVTKSLSKKGFNAFSLSSFDAYSDFDDKTVSRNTYVSDIKKGLKSNINDLTLALGFPAEYSFSSVSVSLNTPKESNKYSITNESIPFYQLALSGLVDCVSSPINLSSEPDVELLKCLETGTALNFALITEDNSVVVNTDMNWLYSSDYAIWKDRIVSYYKVMKQLDGAKITSHTKISEDVYLSKYSNNISVYVNYGQTDYQIENICVPAKGYLFQKMIGE